MSTTSENTNNIPNADKENVKPTEGVEVNESSNTNSNNTRIFVAKVSEFKSQTKALETKGFFGKCVQVPREGNKPMPVLVAYCNDGKFYAIDNRCAHMGYPLHVGRVVDIEDFGVCFGKAIKCEAHFWSFSLDNGKCDRTAHQLKTYKVEVEDEDVYLLNP